MGWVISNEAYQELKENAETTPSAIWEGVRELLEGSVPVKCHNMQDEHGFIHQVWEYTDGGKDRPKWTRLEVWNETN